MAEARDVDLVGKLSEEERIDLERRMGSVSPEEGKYADDANPLRKYLSDGAEWRECAAIQLLLLQARHHFGQATTEQVAEVERALEKFSPANAALLEEKVTKHDQLAVLEELGRHISPETKALLHPGTTSYDVLDTARAVLYRGAWKKIIAPQVGKAIEQLCEIAERSMEVLQVGRTHLQNTSPVPFGATIAGYAARLAERATRCDEYFGRLRGKVSGIVGTGASIDMVVGEGKSREFEQWVLGALRLPIDKTATQIVQKEALADVGHGLTTLMAVLADFSNDIRMMYSSAIGEVTSRDNAARLGGSSADATKNNPIQWENMCGKAVVVESGMRILYDMIHSDFQRDLRNSVEGRYQPRAMMAQAFEAFRRLNKALPQLSINEDRMAANLQPVRDNPSEAMVAILRGIGYVHPQYGVGHDFVKEMGLRAQKEKRKLLEVALEHMHFGAAYDALPQNKREILEGRLELYTGCAVEKAKDNIEYARTVAQGFEAGAKHG